MKVRGLPTARDIWQALANDFQKKSRMVSVDLRRRLQEEKCVEKADVRAHFVKLRTMREDLASMGHPPSDEDFYAIILGSLTPSFDLYISTVNATSSVLGTSLSADDLMLTAWMANAEVNVLDFMEEGFGADVFAGLADDDISSEDAEDIMSAYLSGGESVPNLPQASPSISDFTDDDLDDLFTPPSSDEDSLSDDDMPTLQTVSDSSDDEDDDSYRCSRH
ncbi:hypothetical protein Hypma_007128 [Hypsizygus marmoreus]|uniref:Uncharacterized protein n=1 Tax=Hypsizygus marmoreus TaxID=39966 RepID=A0A369K978_HYPMA|nr:hypothetical protein Hypma_007128 [Hypsizygus marmoreus]